MLIASFDIECTSSHGDFPVAIKHYDKVAREIIHAYNAKKDTLTHSKSKEFLKDTLTHLFTDNPRQHVAHLYSDIYFKTKPKVSNEDIVFCIDDLFNILNGTLLYKNHDENFRNPHEEEDGDEVARFSKQFRRVGREKPPVLSKSPQTTNQTSSDEPQPEVKYSVFDDLNTFLCKRFPPLEGDPIIQIGTTFHRYGSSDCHFKHVITLDSCSDIAGVDEVVSCTKESQVLLEWTKLINRYDPDIITGYNIFGFDMQYMYDRSKELGCTSKFMQLTRYKHVTEAMVKNEMIHKQLSSSALGDNMLKYFNMEGRVQIDLMKVIQRDHRLDSYKLDLVASNFLQGKIKQVSAPRNEESVVVLDLDTTNGISKNSYINLFHDESTHKVFVKEVDHATKKVHILCDTDVNGDNKNVPDFLLSGQLPTGIKWGLAKDDVSPNEIFKCQQGTPDDRAKIAKYCVQDCALCNIIIIKLEIIANNIGMSNVCSVPLSYIFMRGQGVKIFSLVSKQCRDEHFLIPVLKSFNPDDESEEDEGYEGAIVLPPNPGVYIDEPISVMDYASLYPSSMISENISHDSIVLDAEYDNLPGHEYVDIVYDLYEGVGDKKRKVGEKNCRFAQFPDGKKGVLPRILMTLLKQRKSTRKRINEQRLTLRDGRSYVGFKGKLVASTDDEEMSLSTTTTTTFEFHESSSGTTHLIDDSIVESCVDAHNDFMKAVLDGLQLAYKTTANSLYGQVGARTSQIYMKELAASTTATGRNLILKAKSFMEERYGTEIVYGDTDSIFVNFRLNELHGLTGKEALQKSIDLSIQASKEFKDECLKAPHDLEYEKTFYPFIILSKKRYVGNLYEHDVNKFKQKSMGIVLKRRDNANILKYVYGGMIDIILNECDVQKAIRFLNKSLQELVDGKFPLDQLVITKTLKGSYKDPTKIAHKVLADRMKERDPGSAPQVNDRIPYVYIDIDEKKYGKKSILQGDKIEHPTYIVEKGLKPNYQFYISNQLLKPVCQLLALVLEQIPNYKHRNDPEYFRRKEKALLSGDKKTLKKVQDKISDLRMDEVEQIVFAPILKDLERKRSGNRSMTDYFSYAT